MVTCYCRQTEEFMRHFYFLNEAVDKGKFSLNGSKQMGRSVNGPIELILGEQNTF